MMAGLLRKMGEHNKAAAAAYRRLQNLHRVLTRAYSMIGFSL